MKTVQPAPFLVAREGGHFGLVVERNAPPPPPPHTHIPSVGVGHFGEGGLRILAPKLPNLFFDILPCVGQLGLRMQPAPSRHHHHSTSTALPDWEQSSSFWSPAAVAHPLMGSSEHQLEALERAVREIEALEAIYGHDNSLTVHSEAELLAAQAAVEAGRVTAAPRLDVELNIPLDVAPAGTVAATLRCGLPPGYPQCTAEVSARVPGLRRGAHDELCAQLRQKAEALTGHEAVMDLVQELQHLAVQALQMTQTESSAKEQAAEPPPQSALGRRWIWVHHIKSGDRRKAIAQEAGERGLGGYLKAGYPGIVVIEGDAVACDDFVNWIKGSKSRPGGFGRNWGHHVRGEINTPHGTRLLPAEFSELEDMKELGALCKGHGLEKEFLEFVLQHRGTGDGAD